MDDCEVIVQAKMKRCPYPPWSSQASKPLELVHADLVGPFQTESLGGARYGAMAAADRLSGEAFEDGQRDRIQR